MRGAELWNPLKIYIKALNKQNDRTNNLVDTHLSGPGADGTRVNGLNLLLSDENDDIIAEFLSLLLASPYNISLGIAARLRSLDDLMDSLCKNSYQK